MIKILVLIISIQAYAQEYTVTHRGHPYHVSFSNEEIKLKNKKFEFTIPKIKCSRYVTENLERFFKTNLNLRVAESTNAIEVQKDKEKFYVASQSNEGKRLIFYPDQMAKSYLIYKETCK